MACFVAGSIAEARYRHQLTEAVNLAGANGEPIVVVQQLRSLLPNIQYRELRLYLINGDSFLLYSPGDDWNNKITSVKFRPDGSLNVDIIPPRYYSGILYRHRIPGRGLEFMQSEIDWNYSPTLDYGDLDPDTDRVLYPRTWESGLVLCDPYSGEGYYMDFESPPPWAEENSQVDYDVRMSLSQDREVLFAVETGDYSQATQYGIWRYGMLDGLWTELGILAGRPINVRASPRGDYFTCVYTDHSTGTQSSTTIRYANGTTGDIYHTSTGDYNPSLGNNWAANFQGSRLTPTLQIHDIKGGWVAHTINLPVSVSPIYWRTPHVSIYEPPPNGLDGMYGNYDPDTID